jgi:small subunit ribosomal protein S2
MLILLGVKKIMAEITLAQLLEAGVHYGHKVYSWNPKMFSYIYTENQNIHMLDLVQTIRLLKEANLYVKKAAEQGKTFLFIGTKSQATTIILEQALKSNSFYINHRWIGGLLTNWVSVSNRISYLKDLEQKEKEGIFKILPKKEASLKRKELAKLQKHYTGIKNMQKLPDIAIIIDQKYEMTAIKECRSLGIPIISILDTNCNPDLIDVPIPGNDDTIRSIKLILESLTSNIIIGQKLFNGTNK